MFLRSKGIARGRSARPTQRQAAMMDSGRGRGKARGDGVLAAAAIVIAAVGAGFKPAPTPNQVRRLYAPDSATASALCRREYAK